MLLLIGYCDGAMCFLYLFLILFYNVNKSPHTHTLKEFLEKKETIYDFPIFCWPRKKKWSRILRTTLMLHLSLVGMLALLWWLLQTQQLLGASMH